MSSHSKALQTAQGFNVSQVRARLAMAAGAGCALVAPVASQEKTV